jgi:oligoendopeptidase F
MNFKKILNISPLALCIMPLLLLSSTFAQNRDEIKDEYKWNVNDIYSNWDEWQKGLEELEKKMNEITTLKGTLSQGPDQLLKASQMQDDLGVLSYKVYRYPQLTRDTDTRDQEVSSKLQQVQILFAKFGSATSWVNPEILQIPWDTMKMWLDDTPGLAPYRFGIEDLYRQQAHVLDEEKELLLSYNSQFNSTPSSIYSELSTSDIDFPTITLSDGEEIQVTNGNYSKVLATKRNQEDRKNTFEAHYGVFKDQENTYAAIYNAVCQRDWASARARNYGSSLEATLEGNNIPVAVYENLVNTVKANTEPLKKYQRLRKKVLGLEKYYSYDGSMPLTDFDKEYEYEDAKQWVIGSVEPLGADYQDKIKTAFSGGWLDVFENTGKRSGAYSANVYGVHPYMLLNYNKTLDNVFTLGHELGHTMHTLLANENQPFVTSSYTIFVAEVASTFNEALLLDYLLERTTDPKERISLLQQSIRAITGTFYFQTLLADFELQVHKLAEAGSPITADILSGIMEELYDTYYGDSYEKDEFLKVVWARIPHIYRTPFYVYQYATCFVSSAQLYKQVTEAESSEKEQLVDNYLNLLKSGGSNYPMKLLKKAGVDLTKPEAMMAVFDRMDDLVAQLEKEIELVK